MRKRVCERCNKSKSVEDFVSKIYPERGPGFLCQSCRRKNQKEPSWKRRKKIETLERLFARRKKARIKKNNKACYAKIQQDATKWREYMKSIGRFWTGGVREDAKLWREHIKSVDDD